MTEFFSRTEPVAAVASAKERDFLAVRGVAAASQTGNHADSEAQGDPQLTGRSAALASYAKLQADIADVVARFDAPRNTSPTVDDAEHALMALMPQPVVVLPLPPTDQDMIDFVAQVAQAVASQAAMARAAQASVSPAFVDAAVQ